MKRFLTIALLGFFMVQIPAVGGNVRNSNSGRQEAEVRPVSNFTGILSSGHYEVVVSLGTTETLKVEGSSEALKLVETVVENGILKIRPKNRFGKPIAEAGKIKVTITAKSLDALALSGSGSITVDGTINSKTLSTSLSGSGSLAFESDVSDLKAIISGSGKITAAGRGTHAVVTISGSGKFDASDLEVKTADVRVTGSGEVTIDATDHLSTILVGSGNIFYHADPHVEIATKIGSGNIAKIQ